MVFAYLVLIYIYILTLHSEKGHLTRRTPSGARPIAPVQSGRWSGLMASLSAGFCMPTTSWETAWKTCWSCSRLTPFSHQMVIKILRRIVKKPLLLLLSLVMAYESRPDVFVVRG